MVKANEPDWFPKLRSNIKHPYLMDVVDWIAEAPILHLTDGINSNVHIEDLMTGFDHKLKYKQDSTLVLEATALTTKCIFDHAGLSDWGAIGVYADIIARGLMKYGTKFTESETVELIKNYEDRRVFDPDALDFSGIALRGVFSRPMPDRMRAIDDFIIAIKPQVLRRPLFPWSKPNRSRLALERMVKTQGLEHDLPEMNALRQLIGFPEFKPTPPIAPSKWLKLFEARLPLF